MLLTDSYVICSILWLESQDNVQTAEVVAVLTGELMSVTTSGPIKEKANAS